MNMRLFVYLSCWIYSPKCVVRFCVCLYMFCKMCRMTQTLCRKSEKRKKIEEALIVALPFAKLQIIVCAVYTLISIRILAKMCCCKRDNKYTKLHMPHIHRKEGEREFGEFQLENSEQRDRAVTMWKICGSTVSRTHISNMCTCIILLVRRSSIFFYFFLLSSRQTEIFCSYLSSVILFVQSCNVSKCILVVGQCNIRVGTCGIETTMTVRGTIYTRVKFINSMKRNMKMKKSVEKKKCIVFEQKSNKHRQWTL